MDHWLLVPHRHLACQAQSCWPSAPDRASAGWLAGWQLTCCSGTLHLLAAVGALLLRTARPSKCTQALVNGELELFWMLVRFIGSDVSKGDSARLYP